MNEVISHMKSLTKLTIRNSLQNILYAIMNAITTNITLHKCHCVVPFVIFTALHISRAVFPTANVSVRLSVCLSVTRVNCDKTNESSAEILIPYER